MVLEMIQTKLEKAFKGSQITISEFSSQHVGHGAGGAHVAVTVITDEFKGKALIEQHRAIYAVLGPELASGVIHALKITTGIKKHE